MNVLRFLSLIVLIYILEAFVPFGQFIVGALVCYALWNLVNK